MKDDLTLLKEYMALFIDTMKPVSLGYQIQQYNKHGYIEYGHNGKDFIPFNIWKQLNNRNAFEK